MEILKAFIIDTITFLFIWSSGYRLLSALRCDFRNRLAPHAVACVLGLAVLGFFILLVGILKFLYWWLIASVLVVCVVLNAKLIKLLAADVIYYTKALKDLFSSKLTVFILLLIFAGIFINITGILAPAVGQDALVYHLSDARYFVENHAISKRVFSSNSLYPYLIEMFFTYGLAFNSEIVAKSFNLLFLVVLLLLVYVFSRRYLEQKKALLVSCMVFFMPALFVLAKFAYVEVGLAMFTTACFFILVHFFERKTVNWLVLCGIFAGCCMSVKAFGILTVMVVAAVIFYEYARKREFNLAFKYACMFCLIGGLVGGIWYIRSWIGWGNPFYPYYVRFVGENGWYKPKFTAPVGVDKSFFNLLLLPWLMTIDVDVFGGGANQFCFFFLVFLPVTIFNFFRNKEIRYLAAACLMFIAAWFYTYQNIRHLTPYVPLFAVITFFSWVWGTKDDSFLRKFFFLLAILILCLNVGLGVYYYKDDISLFAGRINAKEYVLRHDRAGGIASYVNANLPVDSKIMLVGELRDYRFRIPVSRDVYYQKHTSYVKDVQDLQDAIDFLKKDGFTHIVCRETGERDAQENPLALINLMEDDYFVEKYLVLEKVIDYTYEPEHESRYYVYSIKDLNR